VLLQALAPQLGLPEHHFDPMVRRGTSLLRVLHYPPLAPDADPHAVRAAAHEDINFLTIMVAARARASSCSTEMEAGCRWRPSPPT
jgi:isopenicillin N synthase-like dioxygenase